MIDIYTDGSCNNDKGSYSFVVYKNGKQIVQHTVVRTEATVNRMEILGVLHALYYSKNRFGDLPVNIHTDSEYTFNGYYGINKIKKNKEHFDALLKMKNINRNATLVKVKAHACNHKNNHVDRQAKRMLREYLKRN